MAVHGQKYAELYGAWHLQIFVLVASLSFQFQNPRKWAGSQKKAPQKEVGEMPPSNFDLLPTQDAIVA